MSTQQPVQGAPRDSSSPEISSQLAEGPPLVRGQDGFFWSAGPEPHAARRREMLQKFPQIKELYGPCPKTKYLCTAMVLGQLGLAFALRDAPWWLIVGVAYAVGGVINQSLLLAIHELSHNLAFERPLLNRIFGLFVNLPIGVPVAGAFREYHLLHHTHQGTDRLDTDIPTNWEASWVKGPFKKTIWVLFQGFAYALRPVFLVPLKPNRWVLLNVLVQVLFDLMVLHFWGVKSLAYFPISALIVMGLHPIAGHYISEHYVTHAPQETYSYYGPMNRLAFNVGYHNEHHDFPYIAGSRLPALRALASEYYDGLVSHSSWTKTLWDYLARDDLSATSRIKRAPHAGGAHGSRGK
jgi:sphingolipid 4-desaturase/C4-monooxygenase